MKEPRARVLLVEDDLAIVTQLARGLTARGYAVDIATEGKGVVARVVASDYDVIVLDLTLPDADGVQVLEGLAGRSSAPVIVLTARTALPHRLAAFAAGAADYLAKPFFIEELVARIDARLGRVGQPARVVTWGDTRLDLDARTATRGGEDVGLTPHEFNVLAWLASRPGMAATRAQIIEAALSADAAVLDRTLDSHVGRIRKKLGPDGAALTTVWGIGYRFDLPPAPR